MTADKQIFGDPASFAFAILWNNDSCKSAVAAGDKQMAADATRGFLSIYIEGEAVWDELEWTWIEILEFISSNWRHIVHDQGCAPVTVRDLKSTMSTSDDEVKCKIFEFMESNDLAKACQGMWPPHVLMARCGDSIHVSTDESILTIPLQSAINCLSGIARCICLRLEGLGDQRSVKALSSWDNRWSFIHE